MKEIAELSRGDWSSEEKLLARFNDGQKCFGAKYQGKIVSFTWSNFGSCHDLLYKFPLRDDEAYLYDAFTLPSFRGKGIAPYLRVRFYKELEILGQNKFYSISRYLNKPAINFKKKLNARPILLGINLASPRKRYLSLKIKSHYRPNYMRKRKKLVNFSETCQKPHKLACGMNGILLVNTRDKSVK
jgi:GNAT superfamily N-acetyltransferase